MAINKKWLVTSILVLVAITVGVATFVKQTSQVTAPAVTSKPQANREEEKPKVPRTYGISLLSGMSYKVSSPTRLQFKVVDNEGAVFKDFDTVDAAQMHLVIVREDRTNHQHIHPDFNQDDGVFTANSVKFPANGPYRIYASFVPKDAEILAGNMRAQQAPYQKVVAGDIKKYSAVSTGRDRTENKVGGVDISLEPLAGDQLAPVVYTNSPVLLGVFMKQNGQAYKKLEEHLGTRGHLDIIGPNLELVNRKTESSFEKSGIVMSLVNFPVVGKYKFFMQASLDGMVQTVDFVFSVQKEGAASS